MDPINPNHYKFDDGVIECIDYVESHAFDFVEGNIIKYVTRYQHKNGVEDLKKARWYLDRLIKRQEDFDKYYAKQCGHSNLYNSILENDSYERTTSGTLDATSGPVNQS
jgi:hypothetical protein